MQPNGTHLRHVVEVASRLNRRQAGMRLMALLLIVMPIVGGLGHARAMGSTVSQRFTSGAPWSYSPMRHYRHGGSMFNQDSILWYRMRDGRMAVLSAHSGRAATRDSGIRAPDVRGDYLATQITMADKRPPQQRATANAHSVMPPPRTDPWTRQTPLGAKDAAPGDLFGRVVAVGGNIVVVGAPAINNDAGAAYVFARMGPTWSQEAKLSASDGVSGDFFGATVEVDGDTIVIGAPFSNNGTGAAYVFTRKGSSWTQGAKLIANDGASGDIFGYSVALQGDTIVVGAPNAASGTGTAYAFTRTGLLWTQQAKLNADDGVAGDIFGSVVAVSGDTVVAGADFKNNRIGVAYVFARRGTGWEQQAELSAGDGASGDQFGDAVAVDRDTVVVGAVYNSSAAGAAYVFVHRGVGWEQQAKLTVSDGAAGDGLGDAVAVEGDTVVTGAPFANIGAGNYETGAAYVFTRAGGNWVQQAKLAAGDGASWDFFGAGVGVSGHSIVVGVPFNRGTGTVYTFDR